MKRKPTGFTLLELLAGMVIITIGVSAAIPSFLAERRRGEVDRYTQRIEASFFGLRAKLGQQKTSCTLRFDSVGLNNFVPPADLVEMERNPERIECCNSDIEAAGESTGCAYGPNIGSLLAQGLSGEQRDKVMRDRSLRLMDQEETPESKSVEVAVNLPSYELTPPGTSTMTEELIFLIRSNNIDRQRLRTRCLSISGTGTIIRGSWNEDRSICDTKKISQ